MGKKIVFYSTHCPRCLILGKKLKEKGIQYEENNDVQAMLDKGLEMAPALEVDGKMMDFKEAVAWIKEQ